MMKGKKKWKGLDLIVYVSNRNEYMCIFSVNIFVRAWWLAMT